MTEATFSMGGYAAYVWSCFGLTAIVLFGNLVAAHRQESRQRALVADPDSEHAE